MTIFLRYCWLLSIGAMSWLLSVPAHGQSEVIDSLQRVLKRPGITPKKQVIALNGMAFQTMDGDHPLARRYALKALRVARESGYKKGESNSLRALGIIAYLSDDMAAATRYLRQAIPPLQGDTTTFSNQASILAQLGSIADAESDTAAALRYYTEARAALVGHHFYADDWYSLETTVGSHLANRAETGGPDTTRYRQQSRQHLWRALHLMANDGNVGSSMTSQAYRSLAKGYLRTQHYDSARYYLHQSDQILNAEDLEQRHATALLYATLAVQQRQWRAAATKAQEAASFGKAVGNQAGQSSALALLAQARAASGDAAGAYQALKLATHLSDSLVLAERHAELNKLRVSFEAEINQARIKKLTTEKALQQAQATRQQQRLWALSGGLLLVVVGLAAVAFLALRLRRSRAQLADKNEQLEAATRSKARLYSIIGHDLRSPLTAFTGLADMMVFYRQQGELAALDTLTEEVRSTTNRLTRLLDNLLLWAATQSGELGFRPENLSVSELLNETVALYAPAARARAISLETAIDAPSLTTWADRNMTLTILRNLVSNALKVSPAGTTIRLLASAAEAGQLRLTVQDEGPGLSPEQVQALLAAEAGEASALQLGGRRGTGLGLPLVRQLVRQQGGTFRLLSEPGRGTAAQVTLPLGVAAPVAAAAVQAQPAAVAG